MEKIKIQRENQAIGNEHVNNRCNSWDATFKIDPLLASRLEIKNIRKHIKNFKKLMPKKMSSVEKCCQKLFDGINLVAGGSPSYTSSAPKGNSADGFSEAASIIFFNVRVEHEISQYHKKSQDQFDLTNQPNETKNKSPRGIFSPVYSYSTEKPSPIQSGSPAVIVEFQSLSQCHSRSAYKKIAQVRRQHKHQSNHALHMKNIKLPLLSKSQNH